MTESRRIRDLARAFGEVAEEHAAQGDTRDALVRLIVAAAVWVDAIDREAA